MVVGVLLHNSDDHLRNHGFTHAGSGRWRLSPAFDINPNPDPAPHATAIGDAYADSTVEAALAVAAYFRLDEDVAQKVLDNAVGVVRTWRDVAATHGLGREAAERMAPAFAAATQA
jgi:serine/threonine-protein kinase HipA